METLKDLEIALLEIEAKKKTIIDNLVNLIIQLPDNPKAERIAHNIVIVNSKDLLDNWTAEHYNFKWQYEAIKAHLTTDIPLKKWLDRIEAILATGKIPKTYQEWQGGRKFDPITLHPDVVLNLKMLFDNIQG